MSDEESNEISDHSVERLIDGLNGNMSNNEKLLMKINI